MSSNDELPPEGDEIQQLRSSAYNATLTRKILIHDDLALFRIKPDMGVPQFAPGQYLTLGLGYWESRVVPSQAEIVPPKKYRKVVKRAYSIACPLVDENQNLLTCADIDYFEFYIALVREADQPPALTPRLFALEEGARIFAAKRIVGAYTLEGIKPEDDVVFLGTGTGEAPHNAMLAHLLKSGHSGQIVCASCVRYRNDLAYVGQHASLAGQFPNYQYLLFTTRESENTNPGVPGYVGKQHLQHVVDSGQFESSSGFQLDPTRTHVFLCGNPAMIGYQAPGAEPLKSPGMIQILEQKGFRSDGDAGPGLIRFEKYW